MHQDLEISASAIAGQGLFPRRPFSSGDRITVLTGRDDALWTEMDDDEFRRFVERAVSWDAIYLGNGRHCVCLVPRDGNPADYGNHSCAPNTALVAVGEADRIALTDIAAGEELTID
ncbi:MAG: SET domain-containing protein [Candidatus Dormibacteraceae bacterium]